MKKSKKIAKLNVQELEKRIAPAATQAYLCSQGPAHASAQGLSHANAENSVLPGREPVAEPIPVIR